MRRDPSKALRSGDLSHVVSISAPAGVVSADAGEIDSDVPAAITVTPPQFQRSEGLAAGGVQSQTEYTVTVRWRTDIRPSFVITEACCTERVFQIVSIVPSDRRDALDMRCVTAG